MNYENLKNKKIENFEVTNFDFIFNTAKENFNTLKNNRKNEEDRITKLQDLSIDGRIDKYGWTDDFGEHVKIRFFQDFYGVVYLIFGYTIFLPLFLIWCICALFRLFFSKLPFYGFIVNNLGSIYNFTLKSQGNQFIKSLEIDGLEEIKLIELKEKLTKFSEFSVWEVFYQN